MHGRRVRVPLSFGKLRSLLFDSDYMKAYGEKEVIDFMLARIKPQDVVFDVGAFLGLHAVLFASVARKVLAFEPNPSTFRFLQDTIRANDARNITACPVAVGSEEATADLWGTGSASSLRASNGSVHKSRVSIVTLDRYAETCGVRPDVIKIDVEGAEHEVLVGASECLQRCRLVCMEIHLHDLPRFGASAEMVFDCLTRQGFAVIFRQNAERDGREDPSRLHVVFAKPATA